MSALLLAVLCLPGCRSDSQGSQLPPDNSLAPVLVLLTEDDSAFAPALGYDGSIFFSHEKNVRVVLPNGRHRLWTRAGEPTSHVILADRTHLLADRQRKTILHLDQEGEPVGILREFDGGEFRGPSHIALDQWNGFYFTDSDPNSGNDAPGRIFYVSSDWKARLAGEGLSAPDGLVLSPDRTHLYVIERGRKRVQRFEVRGQGRIGQATVFADLSGQSGVRIARGTFDLAGNMYIADAGSKAVIVLDPKGKVIRRYSGKVPITDLCFGGPNLDQLYFTGQQPGALFRFSLGVRGFDIRPKR